MDFLTGKSSLFTPRKKTPPPAKPSGDAASPAPAAATPAPSATPPPEVARLLSPSDILTAEHVAAAEAKLPGTLRGYNWKLLYSLQAHGANAGTFYARVQFEAKTLVVAQTTKGEVLGGYTNSVWRPGHEYYGTGESFLFRVREGAGSAVTKGPITVRHGEIRPFEEGDMPTVRAFRRPESWPDVGDGEPELTHTPEGEKIFRARGHVVDIVPDPAEDEKAPTVEAYAWTGANTYFMMCSETSIAMGGGGGSFGFFVDDDFSRGSSGPSETYGNPRLAETEEFEVLNFECWGFTTHDSAEAAEKEDNARFRRPKPGANSLLR